MEQEQRREYLIRALLKEEPRYKKIKVPGDEGGQRRLLRSLMNVRPAEPLDPEVLSVQDQYLQEELSRRGVVELKSLTPIQPGLYLWRGDITTLRCGAIVNAANSGMTGCYQPCHACIDNCIHTYAGMQLRARCQALMDQQGYPEPTGQAKLTEAYNLPCDYVLHTVGPIVDGDLTDRHREKLASCYRACLALARENGIKSVAFCCISTGVFRFPGREAAKIAVETVKAYRGDVEVIFNVFSERDEDIYREILT